MKHWWGKGFSLFTYLADGAGADQDRDEAVRMSAEVMRDVFFEWLCRQRREESVEPSTIW